MDIPALMRELDTLWQAVEALSRQARAAAGGQDTPLLHALDQLAAALRTLRTTQDARQRAHEAAEAQGETQRRGLADLNARLRAEIAARQQALVRAGRAFATAWAARRRAEEAQASLARQLQANADQLAITREQLHTLAAELLRAHEEIESLHAEVLAANAELLAFNAEMMAQVTYGPEAGPA
jgi:chromosome segregation ATPase